MAVSDYQNGFTRDATTHALLVKVEQGNVTLDASDVEVGAVEIKDHDGSERANVSTANGLEVDVTREPATAADNAALPGLVKVIGGYDGTNVQVIKTDAAGQVKVSADSLPLPSGASSETTVAKRYGGGKSAKTAQVTASGDTTVHTPASGKKIRVYWVSAINDPDQSVSPRIIVKFGSSEIYRSYAISHWEVFDGAVDQALVVNLDQSGDVAFTMHYEEL